MEKTSDVLTVLKAAERAGVSWRRVKAAVDAGELPTHPVPRVPGSRGPVAAGVTIQDLDAWLARRPQRPARGEDAEVLTLTAAAERAGVAFRYLKAALAAGELPTTRLPPTRKGQTQTAHGVCRQDLDAWIQQRQERDAPPLPPHMHNLRVSVPVASRLVGYSKTYLMDEIYEGKLRASALTLADNERQHWQVRLGDLSNWYARPARCRRRQAPRQFDAAILAKLEALVQDNEPPGNESGPAI